MMNDPSWCVIENALSQDTDDRIHEVFQELDVRIECVQSSEILSLRHRCVDHFRRVFTHVTAYHACRPTDIASYLNKGLVPANTEALIAEAKILFNNQDAVNEVVERIGKTYLDHGREKIGFFMSRTGALESCYSHYLRYGSELFQCIANRLGDSAVQKISNQGTPTLFRCALPISWLDEFTTFPMTAAYANKPLVQLVARLRWLENRDSTIRGAFMLTCHLPSEYMLEHIDMTPFMNEEH